MVSGVPNLNLSMERSKIRLPQPRLGSVRATSTDPCNVVSAISTMPLLDSNHHGWYTPSSNTRSIARFNPRSVTKNDLRLQADVHKVRFLRTLLSNSTHTIFRGLAQLTDITNNLPPGVMIKIDVNGVCVVIEIDCELTPPLDLIRADIATSMAACILAVISCTSLGVTVSETAFMTPPRRIDQSPNVFSSTTLPHQSYALLIAAVLTAASLVRLTLVTKTHEAMISAFVDGTPLPDFYVQQQEPTLGISRVYWTISYGEFLEFGLPLLERADLCSSTCHGDVYLCLICRMFHHIGYLRRLESE
jgi:hypothetical protein